MIRRLLTAHNHAGHKIPDHRIGPSSWTWDKAQDRFTVVGRVHDLTFLVFWSTSLDTFASKSAQGCSYLLFSGYLPIPVRRCVTPKGMATKGEKSGNTTSSKIYAPSLLGRSGRKEASASNFHQSSFESSLN